MAAPDCATAPKRLGPTVEPPVEELA